MRTNLLKKIILINFMFNKVLEIDIVFDNLPQNQRLNSLTPHVIKKV